MLIGDYSTLCTKALGFCCCPRCEALRKVHNERQQKLSLVLDYVKACFHERTSTPQLTREQMQGIELIMGAEYKHSEP